MKKTALIALWILFLSKAGAQEIQFTQFYAAPVYLNPAFAGNTVMGRMSAIYRKQWPKVPGAFVSQSFAYDHFFEKVNSGIGLAFTNDKAGSGALSYTSLALNYSYNIYFTRKIAFRWGLRVENIWRSLYSDRLIFRDQLVNNTSTSNVNLARLSMNYADGAAGFLVYGEDYWAGLSFDHLIRPNQAFTSEIHRSNLKLSLHGGKRFDLKKDVKRKVILSATPIVHYKKQLKWDQLDLGAYLNYKGVVFGIWYRGLPFLKKNPEKNSPTNSINHDAMAYLFGYHLENFRFGYSYDATISRLAGLSGGAHELSMVYEFASKQKKLSRRRHFLVPCAKF